MAHRSNTQIRGHDYLIRAKTKQRRPYTSGELNRLTDALVHPFFRVDPSFLVLDAALHAIIERNPSESLAKFIQYSLPELLASKKRASLRKP
jgi:hypothetical protein